MGGLRASGKRAARVDCGMRRVSALGWVAGQFRWYSLDYNRHIQAMLKLMVVSTLSYLLLVVMEAALEGASGIHDVSSAAGGYGGGRVVSSASSALGGVHGLALVRSGSGAVNAKGGRGLVGSL